MMQPQNNVHNHNKRTSNESQQQQQRKQRNEWTIQYSKTQQQLYLDAIELMIELGYHDRFVSLHHQQSSSHLNNNKEQ